MREQVINMSSVLFHHLELAPEIDSQEPVVASNLDPHFYFPLPNDIWVSN